MLGLEVRRLGPEDVWLLPAPDPPRLEAAAIVSWGGKNHDEYLVSILKYYLPITFGIYYHTGTSLSRH